MMRLYSALKPEEPIWERAHQEADCQMIEVGPSIPALLFKATMFHFIGSPASARLDG